MNKDTIEGKWNEVKGIAKQKWAKLGETDLALLAEGKVDEFSGRIQQAYGKSKEEANNEIEEFNRSCGCSSHKAA